MITDFSRIDTTPGGSHPLSPPLDVQDEKAFRLWCKHLYETDGAMRQHLYCLAWNLYGGVLYPHPVECTGPFGPALKTWLRQWWTAREQAKAKRDAQASAAAANLAYEHA